METTTKLLTTLLLLITAAFTASASVQIGDLYYNLDSSTLTAEVTYLSYGSSSNKSYVSGTLKIPSTIKCNGVTYKVTTIGSSAFRKCTGLTSVTIPNSVTKIGTQAFDGCTGLTEVHITDIGAWCNIKFDGFTANPLFYAHKLYLNGEEVKDLVIPNTVTTIGNYAFDGCSGLTSVTIPKSVTTIGSDAFLNCTGLTKVHITDIGAWCNINFYTDDANPLLNAHKLYLNGEEVKDLVIPNTVTTIGSHAFNGCSGLTSVTIPNSVTSISSNAFSGCTGLTSVTIPNSVTKIGRDAFYGCNNLKTIYSYAATPPTMSSNAFSSYKSATLYVPKGCVDVYKAASYWSDFYNIVEGNYVSGADDVIADEAAGEIVGYYNLQGVLSAEPWSGLNIVVYSDGSRRKVVY